MGFPGPRELVSGAAIRLKYITGDEIGILCRKRWFVAILDRGPFRGPVLFRLTGKAKKNGWVSRTDEVTSIVPSLLKE
jgi:hypothetical protein